MQVKNFTACSNLLECYTTETENIPHNVHRTISSIEDQDLAEGILMLESVILFNNNERS
jgi:hypothetical protein